MQPILESVGMYAKMHRMKYLALRKEGFDRKQALELCKNIVPFSK